METMESAFDWIQRSEELKIGWGKQPTTPTRHTALILYFDGEPELILDFSDANVDESGSNRSGNVLFGITQFTSRRPNVNIDTAVGFSKYQRNKRWEYLGTLLRLKIYDDREEKRAKQILRSLADIEMGEYHVKTNNCRDYIKEAFEILAEEPECKERYKIEFDENMRAIEEEDKAKVSKFIAAVATGGLMLLGGVAAAGVARLRYRN